MPWDVHNEKGRSSSRSCQESPSLQPARPATWTLETPFSMERNTHKREEREKNLLGAEEGCQSGHMACKQRRRVKFPLVVDAQVLEPNPSMCLHAHLPSRQNND